ncbi:carboxypeptidase regulatory-like domain-containing protein [Myxococcus sp. K15C18031901]|uniref:carboxypeptidase regulatory-like domain-containing protein n=1 Tax=Myxococcus dinghuensis TaxID=2906761 RepID=UPI0020A7F2B4|nr:carboxypeptidase regulatory-like domain-containing protein [Myxococcus dinghuensis]MCP3099752.1 carboxypeptidase regulatory-like domain-containing protein [Myxococcus dinghuensis]
MKGWALAAGLLGLVCVWWRETAAPVVGPVRPVSTSRPAMPEVAPLPASEATVAPRGLWLRAVLEGAHPFQGEARIGAATIASEDARRWEAARREGSGGAGPARREDLANVASWERATVAPSAVGGVLGPEPVAPAVRYQVMAWEPDGTFWWESLEPGEVPASGVLDLGVLRARRPTGVRVRLKGARPAQGVFSLRLARGVGEDARDVERASELWPLVRHAAPRVAAALGEGTALSFEAEGEVALVPLLPDAAVRLWLRAESGQESGPVEVALREGWVETVVLDVDALFPGGLAKTVALRGRVLLEGTSAAPPGARLMGPEGRAVDMAGDGRFVVEGLPSWRPSHFTVTMPPASGGRPIAPASRLFSFTPSPRDTEAEVTWRVPAYRWLVLRMDPFARSQLEARARRPYPVFLLERRAEDGRWLTESAEHFLPDAQGLAVSVERVGTYRVQVAASPVDVQPTAPVVFDGEIRERQVAPSSREDGATCVVRVMSGGAPVSGAGVTLSGARGSLPPLRLLTDVEGLARLGGVGEGPVQVEVSREARDSWSGDIAASCASAGLAEVHL